MPSVRIDLSQNLPNLEESFENDYLRRHTWRRYLFWNNIHIWNGQHQLLRSSPTISASTTATNLSSLDTLPGIHISNNRRKMGILEENLKGAQPELEALQNSTKEEYTMCTTRGSINDTSQSGAVYNSTTVQKPTLLNQVLASLSVSLVSLVVGFISAYTSTTDESMKKEISVTDDEFSWIVGLVPLGALLGGLAGGQFIEYLGRKYSILFTDILFLISWIIIAVAANAWYVLVGRALAGFAVGVASLALPVYLGETIQPEVRGMLGLLPTAFGNVGILICYVAGTYLTFSNLAWLGVVLAVPFLILAFLIPETPRWYISKGKIERARSSLQWLRSEDADIQKEFDSLTESQKEEDQSSGIGISDLFKSAYLKPLFISLGLMFFQQMSGINAVIFYTNRIFKMTGSELDKNICTIIVGVVNFASTFIATLLIDRLGRKVLLYISSVAMLITLTILGTYFFFLESGVYVKPYGWLPLASFVIYVLGFSLGFGPIPWLMLGEIFPAKIRGLAASVTTAFNWTCTFVITKTFLDIIHSIGPHGTFWLFAVVCAVSLVFVILCVPETRGQSLQDIERKLAGLKVRRMSSVANLKPLPSSL